MNFKTLYNILKIYIFYNISKDVSRLYKRENNILSFRGKYNLPLKWAAPLTNVDILGVALD